MQRTLGAHTVLILTETHAVNEHAHALLLAQGFAELTSCARNSHGGGVSVQVRSELLPYMERVGEHCNAEGCGSAWFRVRHSALTLGGKDLLVGAVYIPPATSPIHRRDEAQSISQSDVAEHAFGGFLHEALIKFALPNDTVMLAGDFNAHMGALPDIPDLSLLLSLEDEHAPLDDSAMGATAAVYAGIPPRHSASAAVNAFGHALSAFLCASSLIVLNGRVEGDTMGAITRPAPAKPHNRYGVGGDENDAGSVIDLFLAHPELWGRARLLRVNTNRPEYYSYGAKRCVPVSDHYSVTLHLDVLRPNPQLQAPRQRPPRTPPFDYAARWREFSDAFTESDLAEVRTLCAALCGGNCGGTRFVAQLSKIILRVTRVVEQGGRQVLRRGDGSRIQPAWWTPAVAAAHAAKQACRQRLFRAPAGLQPHTVSGEQRAELLALQRAFERLRNKAMAEADAAAALAFCEQWQHDPQAVWRKLRRKQGGPCPLTDITVWNDHFRALFAPVLGGGERGSDSAHRVFNIINSDIRRGSTAAVEFDTVTSDPSVWRRSSAVSDRKQAAPQFLGGPITLGEVEGAINALPNNKSAGPDRIRSEAWKYARTGYTEAGPEGGSGGGAGGTTLPGQPLFADALRTLFDRVTAAAGDYPDQFVLSVLVPLLKKGDPRVPSNYRGIAMGGALYKLYVSILRSRVSRWTANTAGIRHIAQAGFTKGVGTNDHLFVMRHLTTKHSVERQAKPLFVCQIDFEKAFDRVPRELLWLRLEERGVGGQMLDAIMQMYDRVLMQVKVNGKRGTPFPSEQGVKQGCPMSPDLFGLFIETLADFIDAADRQRLWVRDPDTGELLPPCSDDTPTADGGQRGTLRLVSLLFADDVNLLALSPARMRYLLALLSTFCDAFGMTVNVSKCELMVFHGNAAVRERAEAATIKYRNQRLTPVQRARYLGLFYGPTTRVNVSRSAASLANLFVNCSRELLLKGQRATHALVAQLAVARVPTPALHMAYYNACVRAVFSYGAAVWATGSLELDFEAALRHSMVVEQKRFMQRLAAVRRPTNTILFMELSQLPMQHHWASLVLSFWNHLACSKALVHSAFRSDLRMAFTHHTGWASDVVDFLSALQWEGVRGLGAFDGNLDRLVDYYARLQLPSASLLRSMAQRLLQVWRLPALQEADPRVYSGARGTVKVCWYLNRMGMPPQFDTSSDGRLHPHPHCSHAIGLRRARLLMRFRLCACRLENNSPWGRARSERLCMLCHRAWLAAEDRSNMAPAQVDDEFHLMFECPSTQQPRLAFADRLPLASRDMRMVLQSANVAAVAEFVSELVRCRKLEENTLLDTTACMRCGDVGGERNMRLCSFCYRGWHANGQCLSEREAGRPLYWQSWRCPDCAVTLVHGG